jgi:transposase
MMSNNSYTKEFKIKAVEILEQGHKSVRQVAKELGVAENNLYNWRKQLQKKQEKQEKAFPNQPQFDEKELELRRLRARVAELEEEREILKKAAACVPQAHQQ